MRWPQLWIGTLMVIVAVVALAAWGCVLVAGMDGGPVPRLLLMALLLALHLVGFLVACLVIAAATSAASRIGSLLANWAAPAVAAGPTSPDPND